MAVAVPVSAPMVLPLLKVAYRAEVPVPTVAHVPMMPAALLTLKLVLVEVKVPAPVKTSEAPAFRVQVPPVKANVRPVPALSVWAPVMVRLEPMVALPAVDKREMPVPLAPKPREIVPPLKEMVPSSKTSRPALRAPLTETV